MKIVIMAGGKGSRLWPRSAEDLPKQFLALATEETMLQLTYRRLSRIVPPTQIYVVTAEAFRSIVLQQLPELEEDRLILEPLQRDTAPCIALSALHFIRREEDETLVMMPADHHIPNLSALNEALIQAEAIAAESPAIVILGIVPSRPETNYGYITISSDRSHGGVGKVLSFVEKPDPSTAGMLAAKPDVYWNSGIFVCRPSTIASALNTYQHELWQALVHAGEHLRETYAGLPKISIDYAVLEKADNLYAIPFRYAWDDLGSWTSLQRLHESAADADGNTTWGNVHAFDSSRNLIYTEGVKTIVIGAKDFIIVMTSEGLLVCHKSKEPELKLYVQRVEKQGGGDG